MPAKGFVLMLCLLFGLFCSTLALAALTLVSLSNQFNDAALRQQRQANDARSNIATPAAGPDALAVSCPAQFQLWPTAWQQCRLDRPDKAGMTLNQDGQVVVTWRIDWQTQGGEL